jgi:muramoyltetrapeptide carboxypeptidase
MRFRKRDVVSAGRATGRLLGGNLTVLSHLWGTRYAPKLDDSILFLEDVGEPAYRLDRALTQLRLAGAFRKLRGVALGDFTVAPRKHFPPDRSFDAIVEENFASLGIPVVRSLPAGHVDGKWTLPLGGRARLNTSTRTLELLPR